jgi:hypothetical protein
MKSKFGFVAVALTVLVSIGGITTAIDAADASTPNRWGTANSAIDGRPIRDGAAPEAEQYEQAAREAEVHRGVFDPANPDNPILRKSYRDLTAADFQRLPREGDVAILSALLTYSKEYYDLVDSIKPTAMTREQFLHVLLREAARRDIVGQVLNNTGFVPRSLANQNVTISRPLDVPTEQRATATIPAGDAVYRDVATQLLQNPRRVVVPMERDIANQIGFTNGGGGIAISSDMSALIAGYTAGANPRFFNGRQSGQPVGPMPLSLGFDRLVTVPQLRAAYCAVVPAITEPGRARGVYQNMATSAGFLMAREDARNGFVSNDVRLAYDNVPCPDSPEPWNHEIMSRWITGIDMLPEQSREQP